MRRYPSSVVNATLHLESTKCSGQPDRPPCNELIFDMQFPGLDVSAAFSELIRSSPDLSTAVAAIRVLMRVLKGCVAGTLQELVAKIRGGRSSGDVQKFDQCPVFFQFLKGLRSPISLRKYQIPGSGKILLKCI